MKSIFARTTTVIYGTKNAWSLAAISEHDDCQTCTILLEIQGNNRDGYILVMSPDGFFTADYYYQTRQEALDDALEMFEVPAEQWSENLLN